MFDVILPYDFNNVTGSGGESIYSGKSAGINYLAWCGICYIVDMLNANNTIILQPFIGVFRMLVAIQSQMVCCYVSTVYIVVCPNSII